MNEQKLKLILKQLTTLANLQAEKNKTQDILISNLNLQIKLIINKQTQQQEELNELTKLNLTNIRQLNRMSARIT